MAKSKKSVERTANEELTAGLSSGRRVVKVKYYGITRYHPELPDAIALEQSRAVQGAKLELTRNPQFARFNRDNLSKKKRIQAMNLKKSLVAYAREYGSSGQAEQIDRMNSARLYWLFEHDAIILEEFFAYTEDSGFDRYMGDGTEATTIQKYIDTYNALLGR